MIRIQHNQDAQAQEGDGEHIAVAKCQSRLAQGAGQHEHHQGGEQAADGGGQQRNAQGLACLAPLGHGIAVEGGWRRGGHTGNLEQDGRDGAAGDGRAVDGRQKHDGGHRAHGIGKGKAQSHGHGCRHTGQSTENGAQDDGHNHHQEHGASAPDRTKAGNKHFTKTHKVDSSLEQIFQEQGERTQEGNGATG